jgi:citrate/tricarballylate utilization protein
MNAADERDEARRALTVCNACRYCDGFCDVFRAAETRRAFRDADLTYLANLCHNCGNCYHACQYAPPHEFAINVPTVLARVRDRSYQDLAWPQTVGASFRHGWMVPAVAASAVALVAALTMLSVPPDILFSSHTGAGAFYAVVPWRIMAPVAAITLGWSTLAILIGLGRFWRHTAGDTTSRRLAQGFPKALRDTLTLRNLGGGGHGCSDRDEAFSRARRRLHHAMSYGFLVCFAATVVATFYHHQFGWQAPYPWFSVPVLLGGLGGSAMVVAAIGLTWLKAKADPALVPESSRAAGYGLLGVLLLVAASGMLLLALRGTAAMGMLLAIHLGAVLGFFLLLPYGKFAHGAYRAAALLRAAMDRQGGS